MKLFLDLKELCQVLFFFIPRPSLENLSTCYICKEFITTHLCIIMEKSIDDQALVCNTAAAKGTLVIVCSTVAPAYIQNLEKRLTGKWLDTLCGHWFSEMQVMFCVVVMIRKGCLLLHHNEVGMTCWCDECLKNNFCAFEESGILLLDAPISGGAVKAAAGTLTVGFYSQIQSAYKHWILTCF